MEHQYCFSHGAEMFDRPADGNVEPRNADHSEECAPLDSVQQNEHFAAFSFSFWVGQEFLVGTDWKHCGFRAGCAAAISTLGGDNPISYVIDRDQREKRLIRYPLLH